MVLPSNEVDGQRRNAGKVITKLDCWQKRAISLTYA
jgi:hypothetical protein